MARLGIAMILGFVAALVSGGAGAQQRTQPHGFQSAFAGRSAGMTDAYRQAYLLGKRGGAGNAAMARDGAGGLALIDRGKGGQARVRNPAGFSVGATGVGSIVGGVIVGGVPAASPIDAWIAQLDGLAAR